MGSTLLDLDLLPASDYNNIKCFEEQQIISQDHLKGIGEIYVRTGVHRDYLAGILHRHNAVRQGHVMVHTRCDNDIDVCKSEDVRNLDCDSILPHSYFLNSKGQFQAYEYDTGVRSRPLPHKTFLRQLRSFLVENHLTSSIAVLAEDSRQDSVEFLLLDEQGMVSVPHNDVYSGIDERGLSIITGWKFSEDSDGSIECRARRRCDPQGDGQHKPVKESRLRGVFETQQ